jgi:hypothetical protein
MDELKPGQILYSIMGENLIEFKFLELLDENRISGENDAALYVFYKKDCYDTIQKAINGMYMFLTRFQDNWYRNNSKDIDAVMIDAEGRN